VRSPPDRPEYAIPLCSIAAGRWRALRAAQRRDVTCAVCGVRRDARVRRGEQVPQTPNQPCPSADRAPPPLHIEEGTPASRTAATPTHLEHDDCVPGGPWSVPQYQQPLPSAGTPGWGRGARSFKRRCAGRRVFLRSLQPLFEPLCPQSLGTSSPASGSTVPVVRCSHRGPLMQLPSGPASALPQHFICLSNASNCRPACSEGVLQARRRVAADSP
jgi:hypothetical protein